MEPLRRPLAGVASTKSDGKVAESTLGVPKSGDVLWQFNSLLLKMTR